MRILYQLEERINNQIVGVKGLRVKIHPPFLVCSFTEESWSTANTEHGMVRSDQGLKGKKIILWFEKVPFFKCLSLCSALIKPFHPQKLISNSPYRLPFNSYDVSAEKLVLDQLIIPLWIIGGGIWY